MYNLLIKISLSHIVKKLTCLLFYINIITSSNYINSLNPEFKYIFTFVVDGYVRSLDGDRNISKKGVINVSNALSNDLERYVNKHNKIKRVYCWKKAFLQKLKEKNDSESENYDKIMLDIKAEELISHIK